MLGPLVALTLILGQTPSAGRLTATSGQVVVERVGIARSADSRSAVQAGDRLKTGPGATASLLLGDHAVVYLGSNSQVDLAGGPGDPASLVLGSGEARVSTDSPQGVTVTTSTGRASVRQGTLRVATHAGGARFFAESNTATVASGARSANLAQGQETTVGPDGAIAPPSEVQPDSWTIDPGSLRLAAAAAESRRGKERVVAQANDDAARDFAASQLVPETATNEEDLPPSTTNPVADPTAPAQDVADGDDAAYQPQVITQPNSSFSSITNSLALGGAGGVVSFAGSGGQGNDAQQDSLDPAFPGNIFLVSGLTRYSLDQVRLTPRDTRFTPVGAREYYSIGLGKPPTSQVRTNFLTGTDATPQTLRIPGANAYVIKFDQFGIPDPGTAPVSDSNPALTGISGLLGADPSSPQIVGARPLNDRRAQFNHKATFALGEFALQRDPSRPRVPQIEVRRSDQDRLIVPGTGKADPATPNPDLALDGDITYGFNLVKDPVFFPQFPNGVFQPRQNALARKPTIASLDPLRRAALTVLLADKLLDYSHRTGQTQFVLDGKIIDIAGYSRKFNSRDTAVRPASRPTAATPNRPALAAASTRNAGASAADLRANRPNRPAGIAHPFGHPDLRYFGPNGDGPRRGGAAAQRLAAHRAAVAARR